MKLGMKLLGRILGTIGLWILHGRWQRLERDLARALAVYRATVRFVIPPILRTTLVVAEDRRFYKHGGVDPIAMGRAILHVICRGKPTGASTIEQQLVRTMTRRYERTIGRKAQEILLACLVRRIVPKSDVLGVYLSVAYFGSQMNGIQQACRRLGIEPAGLTPLQAASIVARLKYPEPCVASPRRARQIAARTDYVMRLVAMRGDGVRAQALAVERRSWSPPDDLEIVRQMVVSTAERYGVPREIALRVAYQESGFRHDERGADGEIGVMQLMPNTAKLLGVNPCDLAQNIEGGIRYLREKWDKFHDWAPALAAYNGGDSVVISGRWLSSPKLLSYVQSTLGHPVQTVTTTVVPFLAPSAASVPGLRLASEPSGEDAHTSKDQAV